MSRNCLLVCVQGDKLRLSLLERYFGNLRTKASGGPSERQTAASKQTSSGGEEPATWRRQRR